MPSSEDTTSRVSRPRRPLSRPSLRVVTTARKNMQTAIGDLPSTMVATDAAINSAIDEVCRIQNKEHACEIATLRAELDATKSELFVAKSDCARLRVRLGMVGR